LRSAICGLSYRHRSQRHNGVARLRHRRASLSDGSEPTVGAHEEQDVVPGWQRADGALHGDPRAVVIATADGRPYDDRRNTQSAGQYLGADREHENQANADQDLVRRHASLRSC